MRIAIGIVALLTVAPITWGQGQLDRRDRQDPELIAGTDGRNGTCDAMLFDSKGKHLFAVGDDKVVSIWPCGPEGLDTAKLHTVRWPSWRERRGGIKALAIARDGRIVIGGYGVLVNSIAIVDPMQGEAGKILEMHPRDPLKGRELENFAVMNAAFSDDDKSVAYGTADGSVWLWRSGANPRRLGRHERVTDPTTGQKSEFNRPRLIGFLQSGKVVSVSQSGELLAFDPKEQAETYRRKLIKVAKEGADDRDNIYPGGVFRAVLSPDRQWVALGVNGPLIVGFHIAKEDTPERRIALKNGEYVRGLAFAADGSRLAVAIGSVPANAKFSVDADDRIAIIDNPLTRAEWQLAAGPRHSYKADALAFHPIDGRLAIAGGDNHEVTLWDLAKPATPQSVARGSGRCLWGVRVSDDGQTLGFQPRRDAASIDPNRRGTGDFAAFSLLKGVESPGKHNWIEPIEAMDGWTVEADSQDRFKWYAVFQGNKHPLPIDKDRDEAPRCWTFLPPRKDRPLQLVVGHFYGCSVYNLSPAGVTRHFVCIGHSGEVMSVSPSRSGDWFVTAATDQTIAAWSSADFASSVLLGARTVVDDGQLMVRRVDPGSPAFEMGLLKDDQIVLMAVGKKILLNHSGDYDGKYGPKTGDAEKCKAYLDSPTASVYIHLGVLRAGKKDMIESVTSLPRRPLWRFFPAFDAKENWRDYLLWLWWRSYYLSSTNGDSLAGWSMNPPSMIETPSFYRATQLRAHLEKKELLLEVVKTRNLDAVLAENRELHFDKFEPAPLRIEASSLKVGAKGIDLKLIVRQRNDNPDLLPERVNLWIADYLYDFWQPNGTEFVTDVQLPANVFRNGSNRIVLETTNRRGLSNKSEIVVEVTRPVTTPKLHAVFIGVNNYSTSAIDIKGGERGRLENLKSAIADAQALFDRWKEHEGKDRLFSPGKQRAFLEGEVRRDPILKYLDEIAQGAEPDDLLVLFFAGHGLDVEVPGDLPNRKINQFVFCCPDFVQEKHSTTGISSDALVKKLSKIRCRKLLLLDACKSGLAVDSDLARAMAAEGQNFVIMTACGTSELATEIQNQGHGLFSSALLLALEPKEPGHGLFTTAVLEALGPKLAEADANGDKVLEAQELFAYVEKRVRALVELTQSRTMTPRCYPFQPDRFPIARRDGK